MAKTPKTNKHGSNPSNRALVNGAGLSNVPSLQEHGSAAYRRTQPKR